MEYYRTTLGAEARDRQSVTRIVVVDFNDESVERGACLIADASFNVGPCLPGSQHHRGPIPVRPPASAALGPRRKVQRRIRLLYICASRRLTAAIR